MEEQILKQFLNSYQPKNPKKDKKSTKSVLESDSKKNTITGIFYLKFLSWLHSSETEKIFFRFLKIIICGAGGCSLFYPEKSLEVFKLLLIFRDFFIVKFVALIFLVWNIEKILWIFGAIFSFLINLLGVLKFPKFSEPYTTEIDEIQNVLGVPVETLLNHLLSVGTFKMKDVVELGMTKRNFERLSAKLSALGIISKDKSQNNCFVVAKNFSIKDLAKILMDRRPTSEIAAEIRSNKIAVENPQNSPTLPNGFTNSAIA